MSIESASGVILRTRLLTETSLIVHWLTAEHGRVATVAKGARRPKSPLRGKLDLWFEADLSFQRSRRSDLHILREVVLTETHRALRQRLERVRHAAYAAMLVEAATETETAVPALHRLFCDLLACLGTEPAIPQRLLAFEFKLLAESGLQPDLSASRLSPGAQRIAQSLTNAPLADAARVKPSAGQAVELDRFLGDFIAHHLGRVPRGRSEALAAEEEVSRSAAGPSGEPKLNVPPVIGVGNGLPSS